MNVKMKKLTLVCALMGASATAVADDFSDQQTVTADIEIKRPVSELIFDVVPTPDMTTMQAVNENTVLATVTAGTVEPSLSQIGLRWTPQLAHQVVDSNMTIATIEAEDYPEAKLKMKIVSTGGALMEKEVRAEKYLVSQAVGLIEADIVKAETRLVKPGKYKISLDSAVYNN